jgi:hypothetical protein
MYSRLPFFVWKLSGQRGVHALGGERRAAVDLIAVI